MSKIYFTLSSTQEFSLTLTNLQFTFNIFFNAQLIVQKKYIVTNHDKRNIHSIAHSQLPQSVHNATNHADFELKNYNSSSSPIQQRLKQPKIDVLAPQTYFLSIISDGATYLLFYSYSRSKNIIFSYSSSFLHTYT